MPFFNHSSAFLWKPQPQVRSHKSAMKTTMGWKSGFWCFQGCYDKLQSHISTNLDMAIGTVVGVAAAQLLAIVFAFCLCRYNLWMRKQSWATWYHILYTHPLTNQAVENNIYSKRIFTALASILFAFLSSFLLPANSPHLSERLGFCMSSGSGSLKMLENIYNSIRVNVIVWTCGVRLDRCSLFNLLFQGCWTGERLPLQILKLDLPLQLPLVQWGLWLAIIWTLEQDKY